ILCSCLMIPDGSTEPGHMSLWSKILSLFIETEKIENKHSLRDREKIQIDHELPVDFAKRFADYLLSLPESDWTKFIEPLRDACDSSPDFVKWIFLYTSLSAQNMRQEKLFWRFWSHLSETIQKIAVSLAKMQSEDRRRDERTQLIRSVLYADTPWQKVDKENQNVIFRNYGKDLLLQFAENAGANPDVFEALSSLMYHFPDIFLNQGLKILASHQEKVGGTHLLDRDTPFYLENCIRKYLFQDNTGLIPKEMHKACKILLDAIVESASSAAYYLREHLIRSRKISC
ncbi:MAG: hypothetical protein QG657_4026, partial [Acidobacteriota bacterium]|nr:hypothetical protein [Acidobacteriota bacterium]